MYSKLCFLWQHFYRPNNVTSWRQQRKQSLSPRSYDKRGQTLRCGKHCMKALWNWQPNSKQAMLENTDTSKMFPLTSHVCTGRGQCTNHSCISGSWWLRGSVGLHHTETIGASDTRKNNPAVSSVPSRYVWRSVSTTKISGSQESNMGNDECYWETRHTQWHNSRNQSRPIP